jgi:tripartite-type tricarboxylate transporter receptor subunit TctC
LAPAGTPKPIVDKIYKALAEAVKDPTVKERFLEQGAEPVSPGPKELEKFIASETVKWRDIIDKAGIPPM